MSKTAIGIAAALTTVAAATPASRIAQRARQLPDRHWRHDLLLGADARDRPGPQRNVRRGYSLTCRDAALPVGKMFKLTDRRRRRAHGRRASRKGDLLVTVVHEHPRSRSRRDDRVQAQGRGRRLPRLPVSQGQAAVRGGRPDGLRHGAAARASQHCRRPAGEGRNLDCDDRTWRPLRPCARAGRNARSESKALAEAYRRNNAGSYAEAAEFFAAVGGSGDAPLSRSEALAKAAEVEPRRYAEADSLFARASSLTEEIRWLPGAFATIAPCITSTKAITPARLPNSTGSSPSRSSGPAPRPRTRDRRRRSQTAERRVAPGSPARGRIRRTAACRCKSSMRRRFNCAGPRCG